MLWVDIHGHLYDGRWQPMVAIKLSKEQEALHFLITITWQICQDSEWLGVCNYIGQAQKLIVSMNPSNKLSRY